MSLFAAIAVTAATCVLLNKRRLKDSIDTPLSPPPAPSSSLLPSDEWYIQKLRSMLYMLKAPIHSGLLVCAVIRYYDASGRQRYVTGQNGEPCVIAGSLCAERAALMK